MRCPISRGVQQRRRALDRAKERWTAAHAATHQPRESAVTVGIGMFDLPCLGEHGELRTTVTRYSTREQFPLQRSNTRRPTQYQCRSDSRSVRAESCLLSRRARSSPQARPCFRLPRPSTSTQHADLSLSPPTRVPPRNPRQALPCPNIARRPQHSRTQSVRLPFPTPPCPPTACPRSSPAAARAHRHRLRARRHQHQHAGTSTSTNGTSSSSWRLRWLGFAGGLGAHGGRYYLGP